MWAGARAYYTNVGASILVVDPHPIFGEALAAALARRGKTITGVATREAEAVEMVELNRPDLVLTELELPAGSGLKLIRRVADAVRPIVLTRDAGAASLLDAVEAGAKGWLTHDLPVKRLAELVERDASFVVDEARLLDVLKRVANLRHVGGEESRIARLSPREREVLRLLARGLDNGAIGKSLYLSPHTVRTHVGNILKKLEVHSRADAARLLYRHEHASSDRNVLRISGPRLDADG